jgi:hypothetical protein
MRFAYIDSNGNEVPIPSVDALALRIELGAITDETQLYDAQADEWGPATSHEIYHTLLRSKESGDGFVAPPPVAPPAAPPPGGAASAAPPEPESVAAEESEAEEEPEDVDTSFGLTLAEPAPPPEEAETTLDLSADDELPLLDFDEPAGVDDEIADIALDLAPDTPAAEEGEAAVDFDVEEEEGGTPTFDFGGMEGGLEVEESFEASADETPMDFGTPEPAPELGGVDETADETDAGPPDLGEMGLETSSEFSTGGFEMDSGDALDLEKPMSEFMPEAPPAWMEEEGGSADEGEVLDFSSVGADSDEEVPLRERRTPKNKPSAPKLRRRRSLTGPLVGAVVIVAAAVGAYSAWPLISERLAQRAADADDSVYLPPIPTELEGPMRTVADAAFASLFEEARAEWSSTETVDAPPPDWLAGIYLARASEYAAAEDFWLGMRDYLEMVEGMDLTSFDAAYQTEAERQGIDAGDASAMRERADSGFVAAAEARAAAFGQMTTLIDAAVRLHSFLVANEANIEYAPASAITTDPVLEVNPASEEIRVAMDDLIEAVTRALVAMGYRDQVTAAGLRATLLARVQEAGIQ